MAGKAKKVALSLLVLIIIAGIVGYSLWNKPHTDVSSADAIKTDALSLYQSFTTDSANAKKKFLLQVVEVSGTVSSVNTNQQNQQIVLVKTATDGANINCTMEKAIDNIHPGTAISIKGICEGLGQGDADLGIPGDLYLVRCYPVK